MKKNFLVILSAILLAVTVNGEGSDACTNGKVQSSCGSACPLTCANKDNPPSCIQSCVVGCFCPSGMAEHEDGCVALEECPATTIAITATPSPSNTVCSNGKVHTDCGTACPVTCANKDNPPLICPLVCVIGCVCPQGMAEHEDGCVALEECPATTIAITATPSPSNTVCSNGKVHTDCGTACPVTCANKDNPPLICTMQCVIGCVCPSGMAEHKDGCVALEECPVATTAITATPSPSNTVNYCTLPPVSGLCEAYMPRFFYNSTSKKCESFIYGGCGGNQNKFNTKDSCMQACGQVSPSATMVSTTTPSPTNTVFDVPYVTPPMECPELTDSAFGACVITSDCAGVELGSAGGCGQDSLCCSTGCGTLCKEGVTPSPLCPAVKTKAKSGGLLGAYIPQCEEDGKFSAIQCHEGMCWCVDTQTGQATSGASGVGVVPQCSSGSVTPSPTPSVCSNGKVHTDCGTACPVTCANKDNPPLICTMQCVIGCVCPSGMAEHEDGCVALEECPTTVSKPAYCQLSALPGLCKGSFPRYFYNSTSMKCEAFIYGGCGGNENNFESMNECTNTCSDDQVATPSPTNPPPVVETVLEAVYSAQSICPAVSSDILGACEEQCTSNEDCEDWEACCSNGCGHSCMETIDVPYYAPPMQCPQSIIPICNFHFSCSSHDDCEDTYCCSTGCGALCMTAVQATPPCTAIRDSVQSSGLIGAYIPQCEADGNFSAVQCHGSTGKCWCVDSLTGKPLTAPLMAEQPDCQTVGVVDKCKGIQCDWPMCGTDIQPLMDDNHCCPYCPAECQVGEESYPSGSSYTAPDGCNTCSCYNGNAACTLMACAQSCTYNGQQYTQGQSFNSTDGCNTCFCSDNDVACTEKACLPVCRAGGYEMNEGEIKSDGCSECVCKNHQISCTLSEEGCEEPVTRSVDISMRFNGDFDVVSQDIEGFKTSFKTSLLAKYEHLSLHESQITDMEVSRGSVVVTATLHDNVIDGEEEEPDTANITLVLIQLEQDYNSNNLVIQYQDVTLDPTGDFSYQDQEGDDDNEDEEFFWTYVGAAVAFIACVVLLLVLIVVMVKSRSIRARRVLVSTKDDFQRYEMSGSGKKGFPNPSFGNTETM